MEKLRTHDVIAERRNVSIQPVVEDQRVNDIVTGWHDVATAYITQFIAKPPPNQMILRKSQEMMNFIQQIKLHDRNMFRCAHKE